MQRWEKNEEDYLVGNYHRQPMRQIAAHLGRSYKSVERKAAGLGLQGVVKHAGIAELVELAAASAPAEPAAPHSSFSEARNKFESLIEYEGSLLSIPTSPEVEGIRNILIVPCLHVPFHSRENLAKVLSFMADEVVLAGDFLDCLSLGHAGYRRNIRAKQYVGLKDELAEGKLILEQFAKRFPRVTIMRGNHLERSRKFFSERIPIDLMFLVNHDLMKILSEGFPNVHNVDLYDRHGVDLGWIYQIGDVRICHAEVGSSIEFRPTMKLDRWFKEWDEHLSRVVDLPPYRALVECHTHQAGMMFLNSGAKALVEGGSLCMEPQYAVEPSIPYPHPQTNAVTFMTLYEGQVDFNSIHQVVFRDMQ